MNKADRQESERRVRQVSNWLLDGESTSDIIQFSRNQWGLSDKQTYVYINKARKLWEEINKNEIVYNLNWHIQSRRKLFNKCVKDGDKTNARQILNDLADLMGLREVIIKSEHKELQEYRLIIERPETSGDNGNGFTKAKVKSLAR